MQISYGSLGEKQYVALENDEGYAYEVTYQKPFHSLNRVVCSFEIQREVEIPEYIAGLVDSVIKVQEKTLRCIAGRMNWRVEGEGWTYIQNFKNQACESQETELDLKNLEIRILPFAIAAFKHLREINLEGNPIGILPPDLKELKDLRVIKIDHDFGKLVVPEGVTFVEKYSKDPFDVAQSPYEFAQT